MPDIDGLAATVTIRQREHERSPDRRIPIIAMTAHAMVGDRERCLSAGMDDYLSKPIRPTELIAAVERIAAERSSRPAAGAGQDAKTSRSKASKGPLEQPARHAEGVVFDVAHARARLGGDRRLLRELITIFRADAPALLERIRKAATSKDAEALRRAAHALKGALGTLDAPRAYQAAIGVEEAARSGDLSKARARIDALSEELALLRKAFAASMARPTRKTARARKPRRRS